MPTRRGLVLLASGMGLVVAGRFLALSELTSVGFVLAALVLVMVVALWVQVLRARFVRLRVERVHPDANVFANQPFPVTLRAWATRSRLPYATIVERVGSNDAPGLTNEPELGVRSLSAGLCRVGDLSYERTLPRGLHQLGPGRITLVDSLGLTRFPSPGSPPRRSMSGLKHATSTPNSSADCLSFRTPTPKASPATCVNTCSATTSATSTGRHRPEPTDS